MFMSPYNLSLGTWAAGVFLKTIPTMGQPAMNELYTKITRNHINTPLQIKTHAQLTNARVSQIPSNLPTIHQKGDAGREPQSQPIAS